MRITIVGGGTAGWIAAFYISKYHKGVHNITVIESSTIGIIGAGEGSTGSMVDLLSGGHFNYSVDINKFFEETDATKKMGIEHVNWSKNKKSYFAPLDFSDTGYALDDTIFKYALSTYGAAKMHKASRIGTYYEYGYDKSLHAIHFDGHKVGKFFKNICVKEDGVKVLDNVVKDVILNQDGDIEYITLDDGHRVYADLFIDCTGFSRVLMKAVGSKWISKSDFLKMNTAIPFIVNYKSGDILKPKTTATALSSGWMWDIPLSTRRGCGYVFDKNFLSPEQAQQEIESHLGHEIQPIKIINFDSGYGDSFWKNNVLALGLASGFVEPLEATSIHNTIMQLTYFVKECLSTNINKTFLDSKKNMYNKRMTQLNEYTTEFISLHYQGGREDSEFWKHIKNDQVIAENVKNFIDQCKGKIPGVLTFEGMYGSYSAGLANWIVAGMDIITPTQSKSDLLESNSYDVAKKKYLDLQEILKQFISN